MLIGSNPPLIPDIWSLAPTSTMARLRLQRAATESSCPTKKETKGCSQGENRNSQGQNRDSQGQNRDNQGQNRDSQGQKKDRGIIGQTPIVAAREKGDSSYQISDATLQPEFFL